MEERLKLNIVTVPEGEYLESLRKTLKEIPLDGSWVMLALYQKVARFEDPTHNAYVCRFISAGIARIGRIMLQAEKILQKDFSPQAKIQYLVAVGPAEEFDFAMGLTETEGAIKNPDFRAVLRKFKISS
jgi:hypothetical protein